MLIVLLWTAVLVSSKHHSVVDALNADPNIDLIDINDMETLPNICKGKDCPKLVT